MILDILRSLGWLRVKPRRVTIAFPIHFDVEIARRSLPMADRVRAAGLEIPAVDILRRQIVIALNHHGAVAFRQHRPIPNCLDHTYKDDTAGPRDASAYGVLAQRNPVILL